MIDKAYNISNLLENDNKLVKDYNVDRLGLFLSTSSSISSNSIILRTFSVDTLKIDLFWQINNRSPLNCLTAERTL